MIKRIIVTSAVLISTQLCAASTDMASLHEKLIKFYGYQRAGLKSGSCHNLNSSFTNAAHGGDNYNGHQLDGGWYDAGDYIKFGMNLAYSVYSLLKGYDAFPSGYSNKYSWDYGGADDIPDILNEVKFATDYICKAVIDENTIVLDVGDGNAEHGTWGVANSSGRSSSQIYTCSGADIPAEYAADLALMSTLYRKYDAKYADSCLAKAKIAFSFAKKKISAGGDNNLYCLPRGGFYDYNKEDGQYIRSINDKMVAAGVELLRATNGDSPVYEEWASKAIPNFYNCMSYSYIGPLASFETWRQDVGGRSGSLAANTGFITTKLKTSGMFNKVFQNSGWGTARDVGAAAFTYGLAYATNSSQETRDLYLSRVKDHVNWVTGTNSKNQSFICGVNGGPTKIHYRTTNYGAVPGAVVAGPDDAGNWSNDGSQYQYTEVAIDYNAGIIGAVAFLRAISSDDPNEVKVSGAFTADPKTDVDFSKKSVKFSATFSKSVKWTIDIVGAYGSKTITKTGTSISETWDGSADKGAFLGGETVRAKLTIDGNIAVYDLLKASSQSVLISNNKPLPKKDTDILVDDFEDGDTITKQGTLWEAVGTYTSSLQKSKRSIATDSGSPALQFSGFDNLASSSTWTGVKAYFSKDKSPVSIGNVKSIYFSARTDKAINLNLSVELEQSTITDSAYYSCVVPIRQAKNYYRINIADMTQPEWKTAAKDLDLTKISALRFAVYDSIGTFKVYFDNVAIEGFSSSTVVFSKYKQPAFSQMLSENGIRFSLPQNSDGILDFTIFNIAGKVALRKTYNIQGANNFTFPISALPSGTYTVISKLNGASLGEGMKIIRTR